jgi:hypothetical protein
MDEVRSKHILLLFNLVLLWGAWYLSGYGLMVGRSGNLGMNCNYLTARGLYDQPEVTAVTPINGLPTVDNCAVIYSFETTTN